jgi:(4-alkanoyl-5-oxo-2,5-dihydrofuran-3-yl)methyl phosphate reductase
MSLTLVTGAAGNVASRIVKRLAARQVPVRAFVRKGETPSFGAGVELFEGDLGDREQVRTAMKGVTHVYLLTAGTDTVKLEQNVIDAASAERVQQLVKHSVQGAQYEAAEIPRWHRAGEKAIEAAKLPYTFLRPASFASNALGWAGMIKGGAVYGPYGEACLPHIDPEDIAAVAEKVLTGPGHLGKAYELTGPASLTTAEQVAIIAKVVGRDVKYVNVPDDAAVKSMVEQGMPKAYADAMIDLVKALRGMGKIPATGTVQELLGRAPKSFEQFITDNAAQLR